MSDDEGPQAIRRVVTGQGSDGKSVIASDDQVAALKPPLLPGTAFFNLWGDDATPSLPNNGGEPDYRTWFPPAGGYRFEVITLPPDGAPRGWGMSHPAALAETETLLPGLMAAMDPNDPGWHATDTIDLIYVVSGACVLKLDSGEAASLKAGDTLVQNGSHHAWGNPGPVPCTLLVVSLGVERRG
jgi:mannose-6-phosphate isomerase-like protein (cupin superfamily)